MEKPFNILMATDYSASVSSAEEYALAFAKATQSTITFIHVYGTKPQDAPVDFDIATNTYNHTQCELDKLYNHVISIFQRLNIDPSQVKHSCIVEQGANIRKHIVQAAEETDIDMIITGTHAVNSIKEWVFGSHTSRIIKRTDIPVLAIPEDVSFNGVKKIVFATEYRKGEIPAIHFLTWIASRLDAVVTVLHVSNTALTQESEAEIFENFLKEVKAEISYNKLNLRVMHHEHITHGLNEFCKKTGADWLVMSPKTGTFWDILLNPEDRSTTRNMSFDTQFPLLVLPDYYNTVYAEMMKLF